MDAGGEVPRGGQPWSQPPSPRPPSRSNWSPQIRTTAAVPCSARNSCPSPAALLDRLTVATAWPRRRRAGAPLPALSRLLAAAAYIAQLLDLEQTYEPFSPGQRSADDAHLHGRRARGHAEAPHRQMAELWSRPTYARSTPPTSHIILTEDSPTVSTCRSISTLSRRC